MRKWTEWIEWNGCDADSETCQQELANGDDDYLAMSIITIIDLDIGGFAVSTSSAQQQPWFGWTELQFDIRAVYVSMYVRMEF